MTTVSSGNWIVPDAVFDGRDLHRDTALGVKGQAWQLRKGGQGRRVRGIVTPGFIDLQVNGGGGVLFNTHPTLKGAQDIAKAHAGFGTTGILPTLITDAPERLDAAASALLNGPLPERVLGIHIEGPHISVARKGTHDPSHIRPLDERTMKIVAALRSALIPVLITVAPEAVRPGQIAALRKLGAVVSLGHSDCTAARAKSCFDEGAKLVTHLFNGMSQMAGREAGLVGAGINHADYCSIICDGIHVAPDMIDLAFRARPKKDGMILVSDAMPTVGGPDRFDLYGHEVVVQNGMLLNSEGSLAGAHVTMLECVKNLVETVGVDLQTALRGAITSPAKLMGIADRARLGDGTALKLLAPDWTLSDILALEPDCA